MEYAWTAHTSAGPLQKVIDAVGADAVRATIPDVLEVGRKPDGWAQAGQRVPLRYGGAKP